MWTKICCVVRKCAKTSAKGANMRHFPLKTSRQPAHPLTWQGGSSPPTKTAPVPEFFEFLRLKKGSGQVASPSRCGVFSFISRLKRARPWCHLRGLLRVLRGYKKEPQPFRAGGFWSFWRLKKEPQPLPCYPRNARCLFRWRCLKWQKGMGIPFRAMRPS
jgi:hypothetical protein